MKKTPDRPAPGTPELNQWLRDRAKAMAEEFGKLPPPDFDEVGILSGRIEDIFKTDAELFPDELEEYMPHERVRLVVSNPPPTTPSEEERNTPRAENNNEQ